MLCECGCGQKTKISKWSSRRDGKISGKPLRFVHGHNRRGASNRNTKSWKGGRRIWYGYAFLYMPDHHLSNNKGYVLEHRYVWERANGRRLTPDMHVHHVDGNKLNNSPENLLACTRKEHAEEHRPDNSLRMKSRFSDPNERKIQSERVKKRFSDPAERKAQSERIRRYYANRKASLAESSK